MTLGLFPLLAIVNIVYKHLFEFLLSSTLGISINQWIDSCFYFLAINDY